MKQLHKRFEKEQIKELLGKYENSVLKGEIICAMLGIERAQFFRLLKRYRQDKEKFTILCKQTTINMLTLTPIIHSFPKGIFLN
ncbi:MAG: hypothetical protein LBD61_05155 [Endomicrobium sp.]|jgi:hypothetical protein|nr:hypothetical protein [Endomicrobium sp.]